MRKGFSTGVWKGKDGWDKLSTRYEERSVGVLRRNIVLEQNRTMQDLKHRTQKFAIEAWKLCAQIPKSREFDAWARQLLRCSSSVGANYRASQRAKSTADFIYKLKIVEEEADESIYWLELFQEVLGPAQKENQSLIKEAKELLAIVVASIKTARKNSNKLNLKH